MWNLSLIASNNTLNAVQSQIICSLSELKQTQPSWASSREGG